MLALAETRAEYGSSEGASTTRAQAGVGAAEVHEALMGFARRRAAEDVGLLRWLLLAEESRVHEALGLGSLAEYCSRLFGWGGRQTRERLRVARAVETLPALRARWAAGELSYTVVRELTRVATPEVEQVWLAWAGADGVRRTGQEVQRKVARHRRGSTPAEAPLPYEERRVRVVLEMSGSEAARYSGLRAEAVRRLGESVSDEQFARMLFDAFVAVGERGGRVESVRPTGDAAHQVRLTVCERCGATEREAGAEGSVPVATSLGEVALCDAQVLAEGERAVQTVPPATRRAVLRRDAGTCAVPGCRNAAFLHVHHLRRRAERGGHGVENLVTLCSVHHDAAHEGRLVIRATTRGFHFERADGGSYGALGPAGPHDGNDAASDAVTRCRSLADQFARTVRQSGSEALARAQLDWRMGRGALSSAPPLLELAPRGQRSEPHDPLREAAPRGQTLPAALRERVVGLLRAMGYREYEAKELVRAAVGGGELPADRVPTTEELLRASLRAGPPTPSRRPRRRR